MPNRKKRRAQISRLYAHYLQMHSITGPIMMLSVREPLLAELFNDKHTHKDLRSFTELFMGASDQKFRDWSVFLMRKSEDVQQEESQFQNMIVETLWPGIFD